MERETGFEPATFCLGSPERVSVVAGAWARERIRDCYGVVGTAPSGRWGFAGHPSRPNTMIAAERAALEHQNWIAYLTGVVRCTEAKAQGWIGSWWLPSISVGTRMRP